ncbi:MAG: phosphodiester glycosidase family protein [Myxococcota bacterium]
MFSVLLSLELRGEIQPWVYPPKKLGFQYEHGPSLPAGMVYYSEGRFEVIEVDLKSFDVEVAAPEDNRTSLTTLELIKRNHGIAGINGGFWNASSLFSPFAGPDSIVVAHGSLLGDSLLPAPTIGWNSLGAVYGYVAIQHYLDIKMNGSASVQVPLLDDDAVPDGILRKIFVDGGKVQPHGHRFKIDPRFSENLDQYIGHRAEPRFRFINFDVNRPDSAWKDLDFAIAGNLALVVEGKVARFEPWQLNPIRGEDSSPRTGLCLNKYGRLLLAISVNSNIKQFAEFLQNKACQFAINLDGGPSTTLFYENRFFSDYPLGYQGRSIHNAIIVVPKGER